MHAWRAGGLIDCWHATRVYERQTMNKFIDALLVEREGCERSGRRERVAAIDEQLRLLGYGKQTATVETAAVEPQVERSTKRKSKKRGI